MATEPEPGRSLPEAGPFEGRAAFQAAVQRVLAEAWTRPARSMWWSSPGFEGWPLSSAHLVDELSRWARTGPVRMHWLATDFDALHHRAPRLVAWRRSWAHVLSCRQPEPEVTADLPQGLLVDDVCLLMLTDPPQWRGRITRQPRELQAWRERIDAVLQRSFETFPVTTLGL